MGWLDSRCDRMPMLSASLARPLLVVSATRRSCTNRSLRCAPDEILGGAPFLRGGYLGGARISFSARCAFPFLAFLAAVGAAEALYAIDVIIAGESLLEAQPLEFLAAGAALIAVAP